MMIKVELTSAERSLLVRLAKRGLEEFESVDHSRRGPHIVSLARETEVMYQRIIQKLEAASG